MRRGADPDLSISKSALRAFVRQALAEDVGTGDVTSKALAHAMRGKVRAKIVAKADGILSGIELASLVFSLSVPSDSGISVRVLLRDGERVKVGDGVMAIEGAALSILSAERVALNILQYLSGIATETACYVSQIAGTRAKILDTRKTLPGWRILAKKAVRDGGGANHRMGLYDQFLIKENHIAACGGVVPAIRACRRANAARFLEVEVQTIAEFKAALLERPDAILLDHFSVPMLETAVLLAQSAVLLEASGDVSLKTVRAIAETGVDRISIGAITHSPRVLDLSLLINSPL